MIENDIQGRQTLAYKLLRKLKKEEKDDANINVIKRKEWAEHYKALWFNPASPQEAEIGQVDNSIDNIELSELKEVLKIAKNRKAAGTDNINVELLKYGGGTLLQKRQLNLFNMCWQNCEIPTDWKTAKKFSTFKTW